ncbi:HD domain-containing protein [Verrucomicrobia bacterium]|nr:HD domain-containing protein [Verrucomicrobiota bacterium]
MPIPNAVMKLLDLLPENATPYLVGGCVRDWLLGIAIKDFDIEVFNISMDKLIRILSKHGRTDTVGRSFGVIKWTPCKGETYDIAIPRKETKTGDGHQGFDIETDPQLDPRIAASRRDYTINSIMYDLRKHAIIDAFGGQSDLENRRLKHTSDAFSEDPLRVMRGVQFAARFGMCGDPATLELCRSIRNQFNQLPPERLWNEWYKWASQSRFPSKGLQFLADSGWLENFPELAALRHTPQDPEWHPEGNVWNHTNHCCDSLAGEFDWISATSPEDRAVWMFAVLLHDIGKPDTTERTMRKGIERIVSPGHDKIGAKIADLFLKKLKAPNILRARVCPLVSEHMIHLQTITNRAVRRLSKRLEPESIPSLCLVMAADAMGRPPLEPNIPKFIEQLRIQAAELEVLTKAPIPFLRGNDLIQMGLPSGKEIGALLHQAYELQIEGELEDRSQALQWARQCISPRRAYTASNET